MPSSNPDTILVSHVLATLPQNIDQRRAVLNALVQCLHEPDSHPAVRQLLADLDNHITQLRELNLGNAGTEVA